MSKITEGDTIPVFKLKNQHNELINLSDYIGKKNLVLFFLPKRRHAGLYARGLLFS
jgi:thioredoxin-dependent peroxiredoxin